MSQTGIEFANPMAALKAARAENPNMKDVIWEPLYDSVLVPSAGASKLTFFQEQIGSNGKTLTHTNMDMSSQLPAGTAFLITGIEIAYFPKTLSTNYSSTDNDKAPSLRAEQFNKFMQNGALVLNILQKEYLRQAPLSKFPSGSSIDGFSAATGQLSASQINGYAEARNTGRKFSIMRTTLAANQNFNVQLLDVPAIPQVPNTNHADSGRVYVRLNGFKFRNSQ